MNRVIFVDDEQPVLDGLKNLLRKHRKRWDMHFALGAREALDAMAKQPFDVVVSDMRMPGVDGATLLTEVKATYPQTVRVVLSGHAEKEAILRALPVSHQFLSKPCDVKVLENMLERTCALSIVLSDVNVRAVVGKLSSLPSAPDVYWELTRMLNNDRSNTADVAAIIERDPAMCLKVLQLVNSAYFGLNESISSVQRAVSYLGVELLRGLVLTATVFSTLESAVSGGVSIAELQRGALLTARAARRFLTDAKQSEEAFTAALLHDLGRLVLALALPEKSAEVHRVAAATDRPLHHVEMEIFGASHTHVGAYIAAMWGLPLTIVEAIAQHHTPQAVGEGTWHVLAAVHVADALTDSCRVHDVDLAFLERVGLADMLPKWRTIAKDALASLPSAQ